MASYRNRDRLDIIEYVFISEPYHFASLGLDLPLASLVIFIGVIVVASVQFDDEAFLNAREIGNEGFDRVLSAKL